MPCYDPPPDWADDARTSAETAAKILCAMCGNAPSYLMVPRPMLEWYHGHRLVDLRMAHDPRCGGLTLPREANIEAIEADIADIELALRTMP